MEKIIYEDGKEEIRDDYTNIFYSNLILRPSCEKCFFARMERVADFTVGDFWGVQNIYPNFYDSRGVSIVFCNSERSVKIFNIIKDEFNILETDMEHAIQPNLIKPSKRPWSRWLFWCDFKKKGVLVSIKKWNNLFRIYNDIKYKIKTVFKRVLRK